VLESGGLFVCELPTLTLHGINGDSFGNHHLINEESIGRMVTLRGITSRRDPREEWDEVSRWAKLTLGDSSLLSNSLGKVEELLSKRCGGNFQESHRQSLRLPTADDNNLLSCSSGGYNTIPKKLPACSAAEELEAVTTIVEENRDKMAVDLDPSPKVDRWPDIEVANTGDSAKKAFLLIGGSHAGKIGSALRKMGHQADVIYQPNWRVTKDNITAMSEAIPEKLEVTRVDTVVFCVLDNNVYYSVTEGGDSSLAKKDKDGVYHIEGNLSISSKSA
jgi:hypothetical protein